MATSPEGKLVPRRGEKFWPSRERVAELRTRGDRIVEDVIAGGYHVIGDVRDLRTPADLPARRHPDSVTDAELAAAASGVIAAMMTDVRRLTRENRGRLRRAASAASESSARVSIARRVVRRLRRWT